MLINIIFINMIFINMINVDLFFNCIKLKEFKNFLNTSINIINKEINIRFRKLSLKDIIYCLSLMIGNNKSYDIINASLKIDNIVNVSSRA
jgi:hypothetical protein